MGELWYYRLLGQEFGPVSERALQELVTNGTVGASDEVRRFGDEHWQQAGQLEWNGNGTAASDEPDLDLDSLLSGPKSMPAREGASLGESDQNISDELDALLAPSSPRRRRTTTDEWYYRVSGQRFGPFDFDTLFEHASSGQFSRYDEIKAPGSDEWVEAQTIVGLFSDEGVDLNALLVNEAPLPASAAPRPAPVRKQWYYRVLNQQLGPVDFEGLFDLVMEGNLRPDDDIRESDQTEWQRADSLVGLFPDDLSEEASAPAASAAEEFAEESEDADWYFKMDDQELGPVTFERLIQLAHSGRLQRTDPIRLTKLGRWMEAESMVGLFPEVAPPEEPPPPQQPTKPASSLPERPTGDADDWAAAVLAEEQPEPPRRSAPPPTSQPRTPAAPAPRESEPAPAAAAALSIATKMAATASAGRPTFTPPPKSSRKSSSGGGGFSLPAGLTDSLTNPKVLGAIGAVLLVVALLFVPWGSFLSPPVDDLASQLEEIWGQVKPLYENKAAASEWESVASQVRPKLAGIAKEAADRGAGPDRPKLQIAAVLAGTSIPKVLDEKSEAKPNQVKTVETFLTRLKEG
jgi:hypothetical protein